jgi:hypothetical protein
MALDLEGSIGQRTKITNGTATAKAIGPQEDGIHRTVTRSQRNKWPRNASGCRTTVA